MSRHRLQLEAALLQGKTHLPLAHIYVNGARKYSQNVDVKAAGVSINDVLLPEFSNDEGSGSGESSPSPPTSSSAGVVNGKPVVEEKKVITGKIESIAESEIEAGRLSEDDIKKQFPNYAVGAPSKVCIIYKYIRDVDWY